ncbi:MAG: PKD domain-containing protein [Bacteroidia bacterium]
MTGAKRADGCKYSRFLYALAMLFFFVSLPKDAKPQAGCPAVNAVPDQNTSCAVPCANLNASYFNVGQSTTYSVVAIPYAPNSLTTGNPILVNIDDTWTDVIDLTFNFCFFGNMYNQIVVGSNGIISFDLSNANGFCPYDLTMSGGIPDNNLPTNSIMGVYQDIDPTFLGNIYYDIIGTAPCRKFVVTYYDVPYYGDPNSIDPSYCNSPLFATTQIVLYETTNAIDVFVQDKSNCTGWNDGLAIEGIQNANGTVAFTVPARNNTVYNLTNDSYRFLPNGPSIVNFSWLLNGNIISTSPSFQVCPLTTTTYTAQAVYTACDGTQIIETDNVTVTPVGVVQGALTVNQSPNCSNPANGALTASAAGGTSPYTYLWSNGATTAAISGLTAGNYTVTITDVSGCTVVKNTSLTLNTVSLPAPVVQAVLCNGGNTGTVTVSPSGGTAPYAYQWSPSGGTTATASSLQAGTYTCTVTDAGGCTAVASAVVTEPSAISATISVVDVTCFGQANGSAAITPSGGTGGYTYAWNSTPAQSTATAVNLPASVFSCLVTDGAGCTASFFATVYEPNLMVVTDLVTQPSCSTITTGEVQVSVSGGVSPYAYSWPGQSWTVPGVTGIPPGNYSYVVTDANGCKDTNFVTINSITPVTIALSKTDVHCFGEANGAVAVNVLSGVSPFSFSWAPSGDTLAVADSLPPGLYTATVTSAEGCTASDTIRVLEPPALMVNAAISPSRCCVGEEVMLTVAGNGNIVWSTGSASDTITFNAQQSQVYMVTISDVQGCSAQDSVQLIVDPLPVPAFSSDTVCFGSSTHFSNLSTVPSGIITSWYWSFGDSTSSIVKNPMHVMSHTGIHAVMLTATTDHGCVDSLVRPVRVWALPEPALTADVLAGCPDLPVTLTGLSTVADGQISIQSWWIGDVNGASGDTLQVFLNSSGYYDVHLEAQSSYGCSADTTYRDYIEVYKMPVADFTYLPSAPSVFMPRVEFYDQSVYADKWFWTFGDTSAVSGDVNPEHTYQLPGEYIVQLIVESEDGCRDTAEMPLVLKNDYALWVPSAFTPNADGKNEVFTVKGFNYSGFRLRVFDRWGELLYETNNPDEGWDGKYNGTPAAEGVYIYVVNYKDIFKEGHTLTGRVSIVK